MGLDKIKKLRDLTSLGISDCKKALVECQGNFDKALAMLREKGIEVVAKKQGRKTLQGRIESYIHFSGNLGSLVEVNCETDFVAKTEGFKQFTKDLAMHIAALGPRYIKREDVPAADLADAEDKEAYIRETCLMEQLFVKDSAKTIGDCLRDVVSQTGENIIIKRFTRFSLGEEEA